MAHSPGAVGQWLPGIAQICSGEWDFTITLSEQTASRSVSSNTLLLGSPRTDIWMNIKVHAPSSGAGNISHVCFFQRDTGFLVRTIPHSRLGGQKMAERACAFRRVHDLQLRVFIASKRCDRCDGLTQRLFLIEDRGWSKVIVRE